MTRPRRLLLEAPVAEVLAWALLGAVDDLEARALVADHHDPDLGPSSAAAYRTDIVRLRTLLDQLAVATRDPDPEQAAVSWIDGTVYTICNGRPVRMVPFTDLTPNVPRTSVSSTVTPPRPPSSSQTCTGVPTPRRGPRRGIRGGRC